MRKIETVTKTYKNQAAYAKAAADLGREGYAPSIVRFESRRRAWGLLLGVIGYWIIPPKRRVHATFTRAAA